ncbi:tRNA dimethylallyltransferase, mitochondrial [Gnomoniopsis smithogilvyi]|uniref:tRNA dimethylallyltransferase n=1 Tax=Gnomoniopsis smithogilvyi TaxID=1191159 RepID=A0A9W9CUK4_9PEZI|nr:tRNA dimethylallyltransferase, mitochondrial [Gnomoniopsis smithogilvyi]
MSARNPPSAPLVVILGSTGTGKSELAVDLAVRFNGEIINADAMQMYKGLPIITNKISQEEQRSIPHHLLGNISLDEETWIVGVFKREANRLIQEIRGRGHLPIVVGGTHYYTKALLFKDTLVASEDETSILPPAHDNSREHPILEDTTEAMRKKLQEVDPIMADRWHPNDRRKIRRSLEIFLTTGKRASDIYAEQQKRKAAEAAAQSDAEPTADPLLFWVHTEKQALRDRLDRRVDKMLDAGLMDEIIQMNNYLRTRSDTFDSTRGIWQSIGFKEFQPFLGAIEAGVTGDELEKLRLDCLEKMKTATRQYAKYQMKWIPKQMMPLLKERGSLDKLYVLDSTDVSQYAGQVTDKAIILTEKFLAGDAMAPPPSISEFAREVLTTAEAVPSLQDTRCNKYCELCGTTLLTERSWRIHLRAKAHQRRVRQSKRTALTSILKS